MTFQARRRRVVAAIVGALLGIALASTVPDVGRGVRVAAIVGLALFLVVAFITLTASITTSPTGITVRQFPMRKHFPANDTSVEWSNYLVNLVGRRPGTALHLRRRSVRSGLTVTLTWYRASDIEALKREIEAVLTNAS